MPARDPPEAARGALARAIEHARSRQRPEGQWNALVGCSWTAVAHACSLALTGEPPESSIVQDVADAIEATANADGGLGMHPGEPSGGLATYRGSLFLAWARPRSAAVPAARAYLARTHALPRHPPPYLSVFEWAFDPTSRPRILADPGPPLALRRFAQTVVGRVFAMNLLSVRKLYVRPDRPLPRPLLRVAGMMGWLYWPHPAHAHRIPWILPPHAALLAVPPWVAFRRLAGDRSPDVERLARFAQHHVAEHCYDDGSVLHNVFAPVYLLLYEALGLDAERRKIAERVRAIEHAPGGRLAGSEISVNVFETAATVEALLEAGVPSADPMIVRAVEFLRSAQREDGLWGWAYERAMGRRFRYGDTDDTAAAVLALLAAGEHAGSARIRGGLLGLRSLQVAAGGMNTFAMGPAMNVVSISPTSRALQALVLGGLSPDHPVVSNGCRWILGEQEQDGKWVDAWVARWIYGTTLAIEALVRTGSCPPGSPPIARAVGWLVGQQNPDGGFGEDFRGRRARSTPEHTAMAIYALWIGTPAAARPTAAIEAAVRWLVGAQRPDGGWDAHYLGDYGNLEEGYTNSQLPLYASIRALGTTLS